MAANRHRKFSKFGNYISGPIGHVIFSFPTQNSGEYRELWPKKDFQYMSAAAIGHLEF